MNARPGFLLQQGAVMRAMVGGMLPPALRPVSQQPVEALEKPLLVEIVPPRDPLLVKAYLKAMGGDPAWYQETLPFHLFPQWGFPLMSQTLRHLPWNLTRVLNAGVSLEVKRPLPLGEPLHLEASLADIDVNERRILLRQRLVTSTASAPEALVSEIQALIPLSRGPKGEKKAPVLVPEGARELDRWKLKGNAGLEFAILTGDINPIHWLGPWARLSGFKGRILHGFGTLGRAVESVNRVMLAGEPGRLVGLEVRFVKPVPLPSQPAVFVDDAGGLFVGQAPGKPAFMAGSIRLADSLL